jgi:hypothetical protein
MQTPEESRALPAPRTRTQQALDGALAAADLAIGIGDGAVGLARSVFRLGQPLLGQVMSPVTAVVRSAAPLAGLAGEAGPQAWLQETTARGRHDREALASAAVQQILTRVPGLTTALLDQLDLTSVLAERVDVNAVAEQIDVIAILDRVDPAALTRYLVEELDLPEIIQASTGSIMSDTVYDVRMQSISADERLSRAVDAVLMRRRPRSRKEAAGPAGTAATAGTDGGAVQAIP